MSSIETPATAYSETRGLLEVQSPEDVPQEIKSEAPKAKKGGKALFKFPERIEKMLQPFDDPVTRICQIPKHRIFYIWNVYVIGALTCIEAGVLAPIILFALGLDLQGTLCVTLVLTLAALSQIPKRLIKRLRPWQAGRAEKLRNDRTSSFPSRAVAGAVVYGFFVCAATTMDYTGSFPITWWMAFVIFVFAALASFARIHLGCHYLSDCVVGFFLGLLTVTIGAAFFAANMSNCSPQCYALPGTGTQITLATFYRSNWLIVGIGFVIALVLVIIAEMPPLHMWVKSAHVLGLLLPCLVFRLTFACAKFATTALAKASSPPNVGGYFVGIGLAGVTTGAAIFARGRWGVAVFVGLYATTFFVLSVWRAGVL